jgi:hypothetical protein
MPKLTAISLFFSGSHLLLWYSQTVTQLFIGAGPEQLADAMYTPVYTPVIRNLD